MRRPRGLQQCPRYPTNCRSLLDRSHKSVLVYTLDPKNAPRGQSETCHEASWRYGPCRIQDPMMVETYRCGLCALRYCKYNRLGLLIYSLNPQIPVNRWSPSGHLTLSHCCNDHGICFLPVQKASDDVRTHTKATVDIEGWNIGAVVI